MSQYTDETLDKLLKKDLILIVLSDRPKWMLPTAKLWIKYVSLKKI